MAETLFDATIDFSLGQDAWLKPDRIQRNQYSKGVNVTTQGGVLSPRSGYREQQLIFEVGFIENQYGNFVSYEQVFKAGKFQALIPYPRENENYFYIVVSGIIFRLNIRTMEIFVPAPDVRLDQYQARVNWSYAGEYIVLFDFPAVPVIISDEEIFRADPANTINGVLQPQVPVSCLGTYNQNRLFIANAGAEFTAGDPVDNLATPEAPITFTEVFTPSSPFFNQIFQLPTQDSITPITAMGFIQELDQSTGVGSLFIATEDKVFFFRTSQPRGQWTQGQFGGLLLSNAGIVGPRAFVNVNSDIVFLSGQGKVHAFSTARNEVQRWGNVPISREVENYLVYNDESLRRFAFLGYFDNRIYISANPFRVPALDRNQEPVTDYVHGGMVVLEIENLSTLLQQGTPVWAGLWTGVDVMDMANLNDRAFLFAKNGGTNGVYEIKSDSNYDIVGGVKRRVKSVVYTREYDFESPLDYKRDNAVVLYLEKLRGDVDIKLEEKPGQSPNFLTKGVYHYPAPYEICRGMPGDSLLNGIAAHNVNRVVFGDTAEVDDSCDFTTADGFQVFRKLQLRLTIEADYWELDALKLLSTSWPLLERVDNEEFCEDLAAAYIPQECEPDWMLPESKLCPS